MSAYIKALVVIALAALLVPLFGILRPYEQTSTRASRIPTRIAGQPGEHPYRWIAASELVDDFGLFREELLPVEISHLRDELKEIFASEGADPYPCLPVTAQIDESRIVGSVASLDQLVANAGAVVTGRVIATSGGFEGGMPGTALEVRTDDWVLETQRYPRRENLFAFYPSGEVRIGPATICAAAAGWPPAPSVGDEILMFPRASAISADDVMLTLAFAGGEAIYQGNGRLRYPKALASIPEVSGAADLDAVRRRFRSVIQNQRRVRR